MRENSSFSPDIIRHWTSTLCQTRCYIRKGKLPQSLSLAMAESSVKSSVLFMCWEVFEAYSQSHNSVPIIQKGCKYRAVLLKKKQTQPNQRLTIGTSSLTADSKEPRNLGGVSITSLILISNVIRLSFLSFPSCHNKQVWINSYTSIFQKTENNNYDQVGAQMIAKLLQMNNLKLYGNRSNFSVKK